MAFSPTSSSSFAPQIHGLTPRSHVFSLRQNKGNHFAPEKISITTEHPKSTFLSASFGRNERDLELALEASKNRLKFYIFNNKFQKKCKAHFFSYILTRSSKKTFRSKPTFLFFKFSKLCNGSIPLLSFRQNLEFSNLYQFAKK